jgi:putative ABC transport system permease protein
MDAAIGAGLSLWPARFVDALLFGVESRDPMTILTTAVVLVTLGTVAGWPPARRASRVDPTTALKN